jgi:eukaryotic-like serine/threonine-protein kinase
MSYCLNPTCKQPQNRPDSNICLYCGTSVLLKNRYRPLKFLDMGGMSRAYLAIDEDTPSRQVCVIKQFFPSPQVSENPKSFKKSLELFQREASQLDKLGRQSPQIPKLLAYLEQDQKFYLVQEYIDGQNLLRDLEMEGPYTEAHIRKLLQEILPILQFIHGQNIIHRDIKPENVMHRKNGQLVLIDFGMSKQMNDQVTSRGTTGGTMGYAPPEQIRAGVAYPATDIFALGATCIHLLTNVTPDNLFEFQENRWVWRDIMAEQQRYISDNLAEILDRMLQADLKHRYPNAGAVISDLADPTPLSVRMARRRQVKRVAVAIPVFLAGLTGVVFRDPIQCRFGIETNACPVAKGPKLINGVLYFPFEPAADRNGKSAEFNMAILSQEYRWQPGSSDAVNLGNDDKAIPVKDLKTVLEGKGITNIMENPNQVIAVGMSSCEGPQREEELRAMARAKTIQQDLVKTIFRVKDYPLLNLGQFRRDSCSRSAKDNSFQRSMILMGIRKASTGVMLDQALYERLKKISKDFNLDDYSLGSRDKLQLLPGDVRIVVQEARNEVENNQITEKPTLPESSPKP